LIEAASASGADYVKFQTFSADKLVDNNASTAEYQKRNSGDKEMTQHELLQKLELTEADHVALIAHCKLHNVKFLSSPFDLSSIQMLNELGVDFFKIPSGEITNLPYLKMIAGLDRNVVLSTGMSDLHEIESALSVLTSGALTNSNITVLHCNTEYPTPMEDVNLTAMQGIRDKFGIHVGYSDHTLGIEIPIAAVAMGATIIEKHITLDKNMKGPDHAASLEPTEFREMVDAIRNIEKSLGDGVKRPSTGELKNKPVVRKSIFLDKALEAGTVLKEADLIMKRPGDGISPMDLPLVINKKLKKSKKQGDKLSLSDLE
jgi:N-acetylneuraminate synthase